MGDEAPGKPPPVARGATNSDRDVHKAKTPPAGVAAQLAAPAQEWEGDATGKYEGDELDAARARRPTQQRVAHLERRVDDVVSTVGDIRETVGRVEGQLAILPSLVDEVRNAVHQRDAREHVTFTAKVAVDTARAKAEIDDGLDARKARRKYLTTLITKVIGLVIGGGVIHWLAGHLL